jgi:hypothetical protein
MDKTLIFGLSGHFHIEVNPKMIPKLSLIPKLSRKVVESLKIEIVSLNRILFPKIEIFSYFKKTNIFYF